MRGDLIHVVTPDERTPGPQTPGMDRRQAVVTEDLWVGSVRTEAGVVSGWHHHGDHETVAYVLTGSVQFEFGPGGATMVRAGPGDFALVPKGVVHRESNPSAEPAEVVVVRTGRGESIFNVDGPE